MRACAYDWCVYQKDGGCLLDSIDIDSLGMCADAIVVDMQAALLEQWKAEQREKLFGRELELIKNQQTP